jgi:hypothetical protein
MIAQPGLPILSLTKPVSTSRSKACSDEKAAEEHNRHREKTINATLVALFFMGALILVLSMRCSFPKQSRYLLSPYPGS